MTLKLLQLLGIKFEIILQDGSLIIVESLYNTKILYRLDFLLTNSINMLFVVSGKKIKSCYIDCHVSPFNLKLPKKMILKKGRKTNILLSILLFL